MKIDINGIVLNYTKAGKGKPLVLLHGNAENLHIFDELSDKLKHDFTVYAIDSRNHGQSAKTDDFSYDIMVEDVFCFIEKLGLKDVSILGFSDGAIVTLLLSMKYAGIFQKMVLVGVNLKPTDFKKGIYDYLIEEYENTKDPLVKMMLDEPNIELDQLKDIHTPTLLVAAQDELFYRKMFLDIVKAMPNAELKIMKGHDHGSYIVNKDTIYPDLKEFFEKA